MSLLLFKKLKRNLKNNFCLLHFFMIKIVKKETIYIKSIGDIKKLGN